MATTLHPVLSQLVSKLTEVEAQITATVPNDDPISVAHGNWSFPGLSRSELIGSSLVLKNLIAEKGQDKVVNEPLLTDYIRRLEFLRTNTIPQFWGGNGGLSVAAYLSTMEGLRNALLPSMKPVDPIDVSHSLKRAKEQVHAMEARLHDLDPRTAKLADMVQRIENADSVADELPAVAQDLVEARQQLKDTLKDAGEDLSQLKGIKEFATELKELLKQRDDESKSVLERCETAYAASTSVGLAAAFGERSEALSKSMWIWVGGLILALIIGGVLGAIQLHSLTALIKDPQIGAGALGVNFVLALMSVAGPVWFAWLATKQIGQSFKLSEDYAFKASVARTYEGFRRETARFDKDMEARLLNSALSRLDELPLRVMDSHNHGSPWHALADSEIVKEAMKAVPGFAEQVKDFAAKAVNSKSSTTPPAA